MKLTLELSTYVNVTGFIYFLHLQKINSGSQCKLQVKGKYYFENYHLKNPVYLYRLILFLYHSRITEFPSPHSRVIYYLPTLYFHEA